VFQVGATPTGCRYQTDWWVRPAARNFQSAAGAPILTPVDSVATEQGNEVDMQARPHTSFRSDDSLVGKPAILLVEDEPTTRLMAAHQLRRAGYEVEVAENGLQALERLRQRLFPILLTDWEMPAMDGIALCRAVRAAQFDGYVYIILLTARDSKANIIEGLEAGADDYLTKPVNDQELAARLQTAWRILRLEQSLRKANEHNLLLSITDALTGTYNRHHLMGQLPKELERTRRSARPLSVVLCDIDNFKSINDSRGHQVGDDVLVQFAALLQRSIRSEVEWVVRYGGEEFLIVLPEADFGAALALAERIRKELEARGVEVSAESLPVTASFGVSSYSGASDQIERSTDALIAAADLCLYRSKRAGRNRVTGRSFDIGASTVILERVVS
jgi:diguanylate cyclase (GGDEF)-like protein